MTSGPERSAGERGLPGGVHLSARGRGVRDTLSGEAVLGRGHFSAWAGMVPAAF
jgi:hypothetical protein